MSKTYPKLDRTKFPDSTDAFILFKDPDENTNAALTEYQLLISNKQFAAAAAFLLNNPELEPYIVSADRLNHLLHAVMAMEQYYMSDVRASIMDIVEWKGDWDFTVTYEKFNVVTYKSNYATETYMAVADSVPAGTLPTDDTYWVKITLRGEQGASGTGLSGRGNWAVDTRYYIDDWVAYNNTIWAAKTENVNSEPYDGSPDWYAVIRDQQHYVMSKEEPTTQYVGDIWYAILEDGSIQPRVKNTDGNYEDFFLNAQAKINIAPVTLISGEAWVLQNDLGDDVYAQTIADTALTSLVVANSTIIDCYADITTRRLLEEQGVEEIWFENRNGAMVAMLTGSVPSGDVVLQLRITNAQEAMMMDNVIYGNILKMGGSGVVYVIQDTEPKSKKIMWVDSGNGNLLKVYDKTTETWIPVNSAWAQEVWKYGS